jgi:hypothetical protein
MQVKKEGFLCPNHSRVILVVEEEESGLDLGRFLFLVLALTGHLEVKIMIIIRVVMVCLMVTG